MDGGVLASRVRVQSHFCIAKRLDENFGGYTFQGTSQIFCAFGIKLERAIDCVMDLVNVMTLTQVSSRKRCDLPGQNLFQLESLILAQSERWRQA